jgi:hypothetical protein
MVRQDEQGHGASWNIVAIVGWEPSGFYPEYWECITMTNNMTPGDGED